MERGFIYTSTGTSVGRSQGEEATPDPHTTTGMRRRKRMRLVGLNFHVCRPEQPLTPRCISSHFRSSSCAAWAQP
eukprot:113737-Hanusia_phi.AAC.2